MPTMVVRMFGCLDIQSDGRPIEEFAVRKVQELFCLLLLQRERPKTREVLAETLWLEASPRQARANLRKAIYGLQRWLERVSSSAAPMLLIDGDRLIVAPDADLWIDVTVLDSAASAVRGQAGKTLSGIDAQILSAAVQLYRGDLLEGWYQDWCLFERERLQNNYLSLLDKLMVYYEHHYQYEAGLACGEQLLCCDRAREETHRRMMLLHGRVGNRTAALRQFERCVTALHEDLGVAPGQLTTELFHRIKAGKDDLSPPASAVATEWAFDPAVTRHVIVSYLEQAQQLLNEARRLFLVDSQRSG